MEDIRARLVRHLNDNIAISLQRKNATGLTYKLEEARFSVAADYHKGGKELELHYDPKELVYTIRFDYGIPKGAVKHAPFLEMSSNVSRSVIMAINDYFPKHKSKAT